MAKSREKKLIESFEEARQSWIDILIKNPDNLLASSSIFSINSKIDLLKTLRILDGDFDDD